MPQGKGTYGKKVGRPPSKKAARKGKAIDRKKKKIAKANKVISKGSKKLLKELGPAKYKKLRTTKGMKLSSGQKRTVSKVNKASKKVARKTKAIARKVLRMSKGAKSSKYKK